MHVIEKATGSNIEVEVRQLTNSERATIGTLKGFSFDWTRQKEGEFYKLILTESGKIIGLLNMKLCEANKYVEILMIDKNTKDHQGIAGCLFAFAARRSFSLGFGGYIFLIAKNKIAELYHNRYGFQYLNSPKAMGVRMSSDTLNSTSLITKYL